MSSLIGTGLHIILQSRHIVRHHGLPDDIWSVICRIAHVLTVYEISVNICYDWIVKKLRDAYIARISLDGSAEIYIVRRFGRIESGSSECLYKINSAFDHHYDLRKLCREISYFESINIVTSSNDSCVFTVIKDYIMDNPPRIRDILRNFELTAADFVWKLNYYGTGIRDIIHILIDTECKAELLSCVPFMRIIIFIYLQRSKYEWIGQNKMPLSFTKYPLMVEYFNLLMNDPMPLVNSIPLLLYCAEFRH